MGIIIKRNSINFKGKNVSIGIDVSKHSWRLTSLVARLTVMAVTLSRQKNGAFPGRFFSIIKTALSNEFRSKHAFLTFTPASFDLRKGANLSKHFPYQMVRSSRLTNLK